MTVANMWVNMKMISLETGKMYFEKNFNKRTPVFAPTLTLLMMRRTGRNLSMTEQLMEMLLRRAFTSVTSASWEILTRKGR